MRALARRLALAAVLALGVPSAVHAQASPPALSQSGPAAGAGMVQDFDAVTSTNYSEWNLISCLNWIPTPTQGFIPPDCLGDQGQENATREQVRSQDRWLRAGVLMAVQLWATVETVKNLYRSGQQLYHTFQAIAAGFDKKRPDMMLLRIADATDAVVATSQGIQSVSAGYQVPGALDTRYNQIETIVLRALATSKDGHAAALTLNDQASSMQVRLADGRIEIVAVDSSAFRGPDSNELPPLPADAPPSADAMYATTGSRPATAATFSGYTTTGSRLIQRAAGGPMLSEAPMCDVPDDDGTMDPAQMFQRVATMAKGAQLGAAAAQSDVSVAREEVRAVRQREQVHDDQSWMAMLFRTFKSL